MRDAVQEALPSKRSFRTGWESWLTRFVFLCVLVFLCYRLPLFGLEPVPAAAAGLLGAAAIVAAEMRLRRATPGGVIGGAIGLVAGLVAALLAALILSLTGQPFAEKSTLEYFLMISLGYLGAVVGAKKGAQAGAGSLFKAGGTVSEKEVTLKLVDTSVLIDGRLPEICEARFVEGVLLAPQFILRELQLLADSADPLKRQRGRRGLEVLQRLQKMDGVEVRILEDEIFQGKDADQQLLELARRTGAKLATNDFNLSRVAAVRGIPVLNVNQLANALKPVVLPGEAMRVVIVREGKEPNQGIAYLDDGTMVVVDGARRLINKSVRISVTAMHQTPAGKMIFGRYEEKRDHHAPARDDRSAPHEARPERQQAHTEVSH